MIMKTWIPFKTVDTRLWFPPTEKSAVFMISSFGEPKATIEFFYRNLFFPFFLFFYFVFFKKNWKTRANLRNVRKQIGGITIQTTVITNNAMPNDACYYPIKSRIKSRIKRMMQAMQTSCDHSIIIHDLRKYDTKCVSFLT